jgi:hypothetical protein
MLFGQIFLYYYIIKESPRLTLYRLKDKKVGLRCLKNYDVYSFWLYVRYP